MTILRHKFIERIPDKLDEDVLYVSITHSTSVHRCCCGCGREVVTPLAPTDWKLIFDGETVSLFPSIGNWNFPCRSHYWITNNRIDWAEDWSDSRVAKAEEDDCRQKEKFYRDIIGDDSGESNEALEKSRVGFWNRFWRGW